MKLTNWAKVGLTSLVALTLLTACGGNSKKSSTGKSEQVFTRMEGDVIGGMDSAAVTDSISGQALVDTMDGLYRYNGAKLEPAVATKVVKPTNDGKTYTFDLRKNAKWSNGDPVQAQDFVYGWKRAVDPATKSQYAYLFAGVKNADAIMKGSEKPENLGITAVDAHTLKVDLDYAIPYMDGLLTNPVFFPQNEKAVKKYGSEYGTAYNKVVYNGPFKLTKWTGTNLSWSEVKNKSYWNAKAVKLDRIDVQVVKEPSTALNLFQSGKLDDAILSGESARQMKQDPSFKAQPQASTFYLELNQKKVAAFRNKNIRLAMSKAINRKEFVTQVLGNSSLVAHTAVPQNLAQMPDGTDFAKAATKGHDYPTTFDKKEAQKLWKQGLKELGITSLNVDFLTDDSENAKKSSEYFQSQLESVLPGLKMKITSLPFKSRLTRSESGDFDICITLWGADFPDPITYLDLFTTGNQSNNGKWSNADYDKLIQASKTTDVTDEKKRFNDLLQAQNILTDEAGIIPVYQTAQAHLVNPNVKDVAYSPSNQYNFVHTYIAK
ncbi:peptide ABC transporter substrate-binding protein [Lapidilactobacillus achengensis]|uniref:Peptide ABC transporter substrate-binding protein n=1 Tax=Lapidilactobacillus achengensis TaxID=2486000 RepID=A0ABW1US40_9LACO|nr:peptide ABC transporter substrate-binding protein [Lapidilactobacillus achengensis]